MKHTSTALAIAVLYLENRDDNFSEDDDIRVLEEIAATLQDAPFEERNAITSAFEDLGQPERAEGLGLSDQH